ncbi:MAG TPA: sigma-70 family RNA polymerase sigma factor [Puia sp.]|nr:sigma-70 family RNA polymerase sigma factor [Puia sp.]
MTEGEIIQGCLKQNTAAQHALFRKYADVLMTICRRYSGDHAEAEDMLQEAFIRIFKFINQYQASGSFEGWIKKITVRSCLQILQTRKVRFSELPENHQETQASAPDIIAGLDADEILKQISYLPVGYRMIFNLYVMEGYSHEEIGQMLKIKAATSRSQLSKARSMLQGKINSLQKISG